MSEHVRAKKIPPLNRTTGKIFFTFKYVKIPCTAYNACRILNDTATSKAIPKISCHVLRLFNRTRQAAALGAISSATALKSATRKNSQAKFRGNQKLHNKSLQKIMFELFRRPLNRRQLCTCPQRKVFQSRSSCR